MILDKEIKILVKSSITISKLKKLNLQCKIGDIITIPIEKLWNGSNILINVKCDVCDNDKAINYNLYNKNIKKYNIYCCSNKCSYIKNKLTNTERYGDEVYVNTNKSKKTKFEKYGSETYVNIDKIKKTKFEKYGNENYNNLEKAIKTNLKKYNVKTTLLSDIVIEKSKKTCLEKYGNEDFRKSDLIINKKKETNLKKYGSTSYMGTDNFIEKSKETNLKKYGFTSSNKSTYIKEKKVKSMLQKYGFISNSMTEESKLKLRESNFKKYGVEYPMQVLEFFEKQQKSGKKTIYYNEKLYYNGSYEKHFLDHSNNIGILDNIERGMLIKYTFDKNIKSYFPDFYIDKYNLIVEIKSNYYYNKFLEKNISKMNKCLELGYNFLFIIDKNYEVFDYFFSKSK